MVVQREKLYINLIIRKGSSAVSPLNILKGKGYRTNFLFHFLFRFHSAKDAFLQTHLYQPLGNFELYTNLIKVWSNVLKDEKIKILSLTAS